MRLSGKAALIAAAWGAALVAMGASAAAKDAPEPIAERIHSPLPLYTFAWPDLWPRSFNQGVEFGCVSRVPFGDWQFVPLEADQGPRPHWERFANYGVFHCAAILSTAFDRADLEKARYDYGLFVRIGKARNRSIEWELWVVETGFQTGSDYTLLAREAAKTGRIEEFRVLQQRCPRENILVARGLDIWTTRYCSIDSREELLALARTMLRLPPLGSLMRAAPSEAAP